MITTELKQKIAGAMIARRENFGGIGMLGICIVALASNIKILSSKDA